MPMKELLVISLCIGLFACNKDKIVKDPALVGAWRMDSVMYLTSTTAVYKDTIYWGESNNKRLLMEVKDDNSFAFEYITKAVEGKGHFTLTKYGDMKSQAYATNYPLTTYLMVYHFMEAMNNTTSYSIHDNQLSVFYVAGHKSIVKFTKEE
ncbi:MAG: hypothetical protein BGO32_00065 [Bacteroidetes bacterium 37-13]|nr:MAG: hypothetical protein BGO32_00065 [Bacteroidetes bacterium 37-13]